MTAAYELFKREVDAQGRERLDGFSLGNLRQLGPDEKVQVRATLTRLLSQREVRAPVALAVLDPTPATVTLLREAVPLPWRPGGVPTYFELEAAAALVVLVDEPMALDLLEGTVARLEDQWAKGIASEGLRRALPSSDASARLARLLCERPRDSVRLDAAEMLMARHGLWVHDPERRQEQVALLDALVGDDVAARDAALRRVLSEPIKAWP
ncbi:hypothetical protein [Myxococcus qinghaiensis]|uniref:hypothetical protein n=1 Tax=Myxococcus qinghaiensis TaxID=2906758 RepID=UPI0020A714FC|nr:hypothetical protein [Myxococcus qinghaiensis]MCP3166303.1 hypothetical protein [Myxococcus qinghaiensis]